MLLIKNAKIYPITGPVIEKGSILIKDGKIAAIGSQIAEPQDAKVIDAQGKRVYPGFVDAHSHLGINERAIGAEGRDGHEGTMPVLAQLRAFDAANPLDDAFKIAIRGGITTAVISPASGVGTVIAGSMSAIKTKGDCIDDMIFAEYVGMRCTMGPAAKHPALIAPRVPSSRTSISAIIRDALFRTIHYKAVKDFGKVQPHNMVLEAMLPIINKEAPLVIHVNLKEDIFSAIRVVKEYGVKCVLLFVAEGHLIAEDLAKEGYPCLVGPVHSGHTNPEVRYHSPSVAAELQKAGVELAIIGNSGNGKSDAITVQAALAMSQGLDEEAALKAITINPAKIYGIDNRVGSIEIGKDADLIICQGNPLTRHGVIERVLIEGEVVS